MQELSSLVVNFPVAAAVIVAVRMMLSASQKEREAMRAEMKEEREQLYDLIKEDLHGLMEAVKNMTVVVSHCQER